MPKSNFSADLLKEQLLSTYLDTCYTGFQKQRGFTFQRRHDMENQHRGIDVLFSFNGKEIKVDEKAQLDYIGKDLPTFVFELSYLKDGNYRQGWLFDSTKETQCYMLVTNILANSNDDIQSGIQSVKLHYVKRRELQEWLASKGLNELRLRELDAQTRVGEMLDRIQIPELNPATEGNLYFSKFGKAERPINLVLKLQNLRDLGIAEKWK